MNLFINVLGGIAIFIAGLLCLPASATSESPTFKKLLATAEPYKGWFGVGLSFWGLWRVLGAVLGLRAIGVAPLWWLTNAIAGVMCAAAGFVLGYEMMQKRFLLNASDQTKKRVATVHKWLTVNQNSVSLLTLVVSAWFIIYSVILFGGIRI